MKRALNAYLFWEFGVGDSDADATQITDQWPFRLEEVLSFDHQGRAIHLFRFEDHGDAYYAVHGRNLNFFPVTGFTPEAAKDQIIGSAWIGSRHPVDLNTARGDDPVVPRLPDRRRRFEALAARLRPGTPVKILEGLFLETSREHLGLIAFEGDGTAHIVGDRITVRHVPYAGASPWRRLSAGIGRLVVEGRLGE
jgi:hypothetical protein